MNELMADHCNSITQMDVQIVWQCGSLYKKEFLQLQKNNIHITAFIDDMTTAYAAADVIISRAGALAVSELCQVGKAVLFIPSPNVAENHQYKNAMAIASEEAAVVIEEKELEHRFQYEIDALLTDVEWRRAG